MFDGHNPSIRKRGWIRSQVDNYSTSIEDGSAVDLTHVTAVISSSLGPRQIPRPVSSNFPWMEPEMNG